MSFDVAVRDYPRLGLGLAVDNPNDGDITNNRSTESLDVEGIPDLHSTLHLDPLIAGSSSTASLTVFNDGTVTADAPTVITFDNPSTDDGLVPTSVSGSGWTCVGSGVAMSCTNPGPIVANGSLSPLSVTLAVDGSRDDAGVPCSAQPYGDRLLRACRSVGVAGLIGVRFNVHNAADPVPAAGRLVVGLRRATRRSVGIRVCRRAAPGRAGNADHLGAQLRRAGCHGHGERRDATRVRPARRSVGWRAGQLLARHGPAR